MARVSRRSTGPSSSSNSGPSPQALRIGTISVLVPAAPQPARALGDCLTDLETRWRREGHLAALWQAWPRIAGPQLAAHCRPLQLQAGRLSVGAAPGPWLQALQYHRHQLLGALRGAGFPVRELRVQQVYATPAPVPASDQEAEVWAAHPSRIDVHGLADCPDCRRPAPAGEMARWGHCSFCRRHRLEVDQRLAGAGAGVVAVTGAGSLPVQSLSTQAK
jgi:predicted nucleic acid-binding Zn ribbon protein